MRNKSEADHVDRDRAGNSNKEDTVSGEDGGMREETKRTKERPEGRKERKKRRKAPPTQITAGRIILHIFLLLLLILTFALGRANDNFGMVSFDEIVFHINMPLEGTATNLLQDFMKQAVLRGFLVWLVLMALVHFPAGKAIEIRTRLEDGGEKRFWIFPVRLPLVFLSAVSAVWFCWLFFTVDAKFHADRRRICFPGEGLHSVSGEKEESDLHLSGICGILYAGYRKRRAFQDELYPGDDADRGRKCELLAE